MLSVFNVAFESCLIFFNPPSLFDFYNGDVDEAVAKDDSRSGADVK